MKKTNKLSKIKKAFGVGLISGAMVLTMFSGAGQAGAENIVGKCTITIDANKHIGAENMAFGTGNCKNGVIGWYFKEVGSFMVDGHYTKNGVVNGEKYTASMPPLGTHEVTIYTIPPKGQKPNPPIVEKPDPNQIFKDVPNTHWAFENINTMHKQGIINGYTDKTFKPNQPISRAHVAALFSRSLDLKPVRAGKEFKDVPKSSAYYSDVQKVYRAGIFDGASETTFGANDNLTRAQMAKVMVNAFKLDMKNTGGNAFTDVPNNYWAKPYINSLYNNGLSYGSGGKYMPSDSVTRAQYSAFLYRALEGNK